MALGMRSMQLSSLMVIQPAIYNMMVTCYQIMSDVMQKLPSAMTIYLCIQYIVCAFATLLH